MDKAFRENLTQFIVAMLVGWLIMYLLPAKVFFEMYVPSSFFWLFWLIILAIIGRGWPVTPPEGYWKPGMSKAGAGFLITALWLVLALLNTFFATAIWPAIPLFPVTLYFGVLLFMTTLWYAFIWGAYPVAAKSGVLNVVIGTIVILAITAILWLTLPNFEGTPWAESAFNPNGVFQIDYMLGFAVWIIAWIMIFGNILSLQRYPFYKLGEPLGQIVLTVAVVLLGYVSWSVTLTFMNPSFSFAGVAGSIIGWVLFHSAIFGYYPNAKHIQPQRGIYNLAVVAVMVVIWIPLLRVVLGPILAKASAAGIPFDISIISMLYTLHVVAILLVAHSLFWFKMPYAPPGPPIGPEEIPPGVQECPSSEVNSFS